MCILKKLFNKLKAKKEKEPECWYNNYHEKKKGRWDIPMPEEGAPNENSYFYTAAMKAAKYQG